MKKLITPMILLALTLPVHALAQPGDGPPPPGHDGPHGPRHERVERGHDSGSDERHRPGRVGRGERSDRPEHDERPDRRGQQRHEPLAVDQVEEALATLREMHGDAPPPWMERVEQLAKENPEEAARRLSRFPRLHELMATRESRPEEFALRSEQGQLMRRVFPLVRQARELRAQLQGSEPNPEVQAELDTLRVQIREQIGRLFELRLELKAMEIQTMRDQLEQAEQEHAELKADRESLIDSKLDEMLEGEPAFRGGRP